MLSPYLQNMCPSFLSVVNGILHSLSSILTDCVALRCDLQELVTFSPCPLLKSPEISNAGKHLSAAEFHSVLQSASEFYFYLIFFIACCCIEFLI